MSARPPVGGQLALDSEAPFVHNGRATLSADGLYRYSLFRNIEGQVGGHLVWLMLNPSTADAEKDDPTIRKVMGFTRRAGYGGAWVVNLYAWRATSPKDLCRVVTERGGEVAEGPDNRAAIRSVIEGSGPIVCAWGATGWAKPQAGSILSMLHGRQLLCLGRTKYGDPLHPLMPSYDGHPLIPFEASP